MCVGGEGAGRWDKGKKSKRGPSGAWPGEETTESRWSRPALRYMSTHSCKIGNVYRSDPPGWEECDLEHFVENKRARERAVSGLGSHRNQSATHFFL